MVAGFAKSAALLTQIMNLRRLAPDIQEEVLFLPRVLRGKEPFVVLMIASSLMYVTSPPSHANSACHGR